jgi:hypothetical protein
VPVWRSNSGRWTLRRPPFRVGLIAGARAVTGLSRSRRRKALDQLAGFKRLAYSRSVGLLPTPRNPLGVRDKHQDTEDRSARKRARSDLEQRWAE